MKRKFYASIASKLQAIQNCKKTGNKEWEDKHTGSVETLCNMYLPCGAGIDSGTTLSWEDSKPDKLVFDLSYHHMNHNGFYTYWTDHRVIVTPSLSNGFDIRITGRNDNDIKDYLYEVFDSVLNLEIEA